MIPRHEDLAGLLAALRAAGVRVGVDDVARLHQVLAQELPPSVAELPVVLAGLLATSREEAERVRGLATEWIVAWSARAEPREPIVVPPVAPAVVVGPRRRRLAWLAGLLLGAGVLAVLTWVLWPPAPLELRGLAPVSLPAPRLSEEPVPVPKPVATFRAWMPTFEVTRAPAERPWVWPLVLGAASLLLGLGLWLGLRRRSWLPDAAPTPTVPGPPRARLALPPPRDTTLLSGAEADALVWGVGQYVADEPTHRLDVDRTVERTAASGGVPALCFHQARHPREVWLWLDESNEAPDAEQLAAETAAALRAGGLTVEVARYWGVPDRLQGQEGAALSPAELDERRDTALVAVLTDGRELVRAAAGDALGGRVPPLLRALARWPRLAFVDFGDADGSGLLPLLRRYGLEAVAPAELARVLGGVTSGTRAAPTAGLSGEAKLWAAACALAPWPVDEPSALWLRGRLGLAVPAVALADLRRSSLPGGALRWSRDSRAELLRWAVDAGMSDGALHPRSVLCRALAAWVGRLKEERKQRSAKEAEVPWARSPAEQRLGLDLAVLQVWTEPEGAAEALHALWSGPLRDEVAGALGWLVPSDFRGRAVEGGCAVLPWRLAEVEDAAARVALLDMGLGRDAGLVRKESLKPPGRVTVALGACAGLGVGALGVAAALWLGATPPVEASLSDEAPPDGTWSQLVGDGDARVAEAGPRQFAVAGPRVGDGETVRVAWHEEEVACRRDFADGSVALYCGDRREVTRPLPEDVRRSVVVLVGAGEDALKLSGPGDDDPTPLAASLLGGGTADAVVVGRTGSQAALDTLGASGMAGQDAQLLILSVVVGEDWTPPLPGRFASLTMGGWTEGRRALEFDGVREASRVWSDSRTLQGDPRAVLVAGVGDGVIPPPGPHSSPDPCPPLSEVHEKSGIELVRLCSTRTYGKDLLMGSPDNDSGAYDNEKPAHPVALSELWMGRTEVTNAQYRRFVPKHEGADDLPATRVSWTEARDYCRHFGLDLPTEAQWEYACRAGTTTRYSFGDDEKDLGAHAWFTDNSENDTHPVAKKAPNPWGLYDMHGNAWEWVLDCYDAGVYKRLYDQKTAPVDIVIGNDNDKCGFRVLRGGSFWDEAGYLRSAFRDRRRPGFQFGYGGFRCVRSARPQPWPSPP